MDDDEWTPADVARADQLAAEALGAWRAEVTAVLELVRARRAEHPDELPGLTFATLVAELQARMADRTAGDQLTGLTFLAAMAILQLAEVHNG